MMKYIIAITAVPLLLLGWLLVQQMGRHFAKHHPELGVFREEGGGCGKSCSCSGKSSCQNKP
ncbi:MAG: chemotaxis protein [Gammaproteobacteria bacterium]|nr:chemotaxis protein [Gammaproteobacteria bacterium]NNJ92345.1 chemotaxis protein [Gammaproteobacteria bacterium]